MWLQRNSTRKQYNRFVICVKSCIRSRNILKCLLGLKTKTLIALCFRRSLCLGSCLCTRAYGKSDPKAQKVL